QFERVEQAGEIPGLDNGRMICGLRVIVRIIIAPAVSDDAVMLGKQADLGAPFPIIISCAMNQNYGRTGSGFLVMELNAVNGDDFYRAGRIVSIRVGLRGELL